MFRACLLPSVLALVSSEVMLRGAFVKPHYGDPYTASCRTDEMNITIQGIPGALCSPVCVEPGNLCFQDKPPGTVAMPECALEDAASGTKYCALACNTTLAFACGSDEHMTCQHLDKHLGICTYLF